jgi:hypothetical protein
MAKRRKTRTEALAAGILKKFSVLSKLALAESQQKGGTKPAIEEMRLLAFSLAAFGLLDELIADVLVIAEENGVSTHGELETVACRIGTQEWKRQEQENVRAAMRELVN